MNLTAPISIKAKYSLTLIGCLLFLVCWEIISYAPPDYSALVPPLHLIPAALLREIRSGFWWNALLSSLSHYLIGLTIGITSGMFAGALSARIPVIDALTVGINRVLRPIPPLAWIPFAILWFGISRAAAAFIISSGVFWIVYQATFSSIRAVDPKYDELFRSFGRVGMIDTLFRLYLPAASPGICGGVRSAIAQGWMMVVAAELFGIAGLGERLWSASGLLATDVVVVYMVTIAIVYSILDLLYCKIERRILKWMPEQ